MALFRSLGRFRLVSTVLLICAFAGIATMIVSDIMHRFLPLPIHQHMGAYPLILIGMSYVCMQFSMKRSRRELIQGLLLGLAFILWGSEQLLPPTRLTIVMDEAVIGIFVLDLGLIILEHLQRKGHELP